MVRTASTIALAALCLAVFSVRACPAKLPPVPPPGRADLVPMSANAAAPRFAIVGDLVVRPYKMARLSVSGAPAGATLEWDVSPDEHIEEEVVGDRLLFTAPPGRYRVTVYARTVEAGKVLSRRARAVVVVEGPDCGGAPPAPAPPAPKPPAPLPKADPVKATAKLVVGGSMCTITPVWPRRADGRWDLACAAHCVPGVGATGTVTLPDGREFRAQCTAHKGKQGKVSPPDLAWFTTLDANLEGIPFVHLAKVAPGPGDAVWQNGYGTTTGRKVMRGTVQGIIEGGTMLATDLWCSPGDSGGGIFLARTNELVATVCCGPKAGKGCYGGLSTELARMPRAPLNPKGGALSPPDCCPLPLYPLFGLARGTHARELPDVVAMRRGLVATTEAWLSRRSAPDGPSARPSQPPFSAPPIN